MNRLSILKVACVVVCTLFMGMPAGAASGLVTMDSGEVVQAEWLAQESALGPEATVCLTTLFAWNNYGNVGGANYFDIEVICSGGITVESFEINTSVSGSFGIDVYITPGTSIGVETNPGAWTLVASGTGTGQGLNVPSPVDVPDFNLPAGTYGMAIVGVGTELRYTNGTGGNQFYSDTNIALSLGKASNVPFTAPLFNPRVWNGTICYDDSNCGSQPPPGGGCSAAQCAFLDCSICDVQDTADSIETKVDDLTADVADVKAELVDMKAEIVDIQAAIDEIDFDGLPCEIIILMSQLPHGPDIPITHPCYEPPLTIGGGINTPR